MKELLKNTYQNIEALKGKRLIYTLITVFISFLGLGILVGYITNTTLNKNEISDKNSVTIKEKSNKEFSGKVTYVNPEHYPEDEISYVLVQSNGDELLLKSKDQKLAIAEGLYVKVSGKISKTKSTKEEVLLVEEVVINNAAD